MTRTIKRFILLSLAAALAIAVLILSYPRLASSLGYIPVDAALRRHWQDYPIKQSQFPVLIVIAQKTIEKLDLAHYWQGLGWLYYLQATDFNTETTEGQKSLALSQGAFKNALKKSPASPAIWLRLAWVHELQKHQPDKIVQALGMSLYTGRAQRYLIFNRLALILRYANDFDEEDRALIRDQIQLAWRFDSKGVLQYMRSGGLDTSSLLELIADSNPELNQEIKDKL